MGYYDGWDDPEVRRAFVDDRRRWGLLRLLVMIVVTLLVLAALTGCKSPTVEPDPPAAVTAMKPAPLLVTTRTFREGMVEVFDNRDGSTTIDVKLFNRDVMLRHTTRRLPVRFGFDGILFTITEDRQVLIDDEGVIVMSLIPTVVRAVDGQLYRNPTIIFDAGFICFDDDDPPELVLWDNPEHFQNPTAVLDDELGPEAWRGLDPQGDAKRAVLKPDQGEDDTLEWRDASAFFFELLSPIPVPQLSDGVVTRDELGQCCIYDFDSRP